MTSRGPLTLAALASAAVPGLDPDTVEGVLPSGPGDPVEVAFISDQEHRRWVIRCPRTPAASAHLERSAALLALLARRVTMPVPAVKGWVALPEGGRAAVHSYLTGRLVNLAGIGAGSTLATGLGRIIAQLHNLDPRVYEEAGAPVYDAASYRTRRLAELDRAAATGRVPTGLLTRWEQVLDDETLWAFTTTPTHGAIGGETVLATPDDGTDIDVKALLGWESAQVADPADDLAPLLAELDPEAFDTVLEAYAHARVERPDRNLQERARVVGEMQLVRSMMIAVAAGDDIGAEDHAAQLRRLDDRLAREDEAARPAVPEPHLRTEAHTGTDTSDDAVQVEHPAAPTPVQTPTDAATTTQGGTTPDDAETPGEDSTDETDGTDDTDGPGPSGTRAAGAPVTPSPDEQPETSDESSAGSTDPSARDEAPQSRDEGAPPPSPEKKGNDHVTAEISPINDEDDGDDVVPLTPRR